MSRKGTLDVAFLGCGQAATMHGRTLSRMGAPVRLHYASRRREKATALMQKLHGQGAFASYAEAIDDPAIDAIVVTTPPALHLDLTVQALEAGKDVIVEKPAFLQAEDFQRVREAMSHSGARTFVAENYFYKPVRQRLHRVLTDGLVGEPLFLQFNAVKDQAPRDWRNDGTLAGGGGLFEGGIHWINLMANLGLQVEDAAGFRAGSVTGSVATHGAGEHPPEPQPTGRTAEPTAPGGAESLVAVLNYAGGAVGTLHFSWEVPSPMKGLRISRIYGRAGSVVFESNGVFVAVRGNRSRLYFPGLRDIAGYRAMFTDILDSIHTGREPAMTMDMAEKDVHLVHQIYRSMDGT